MNKDNWLNFRRLPLLLTTFLVIADQLTKQLIVHNVQLYREHIPVIKGFFDIVHTRNTGAAWGIFSDYTYILTFISIAAAVLMIVFFKKLAEERPLQAVGLILIIAGTIGNMIDRAYLNYVIDFLSFHWKNSYHFPAFNVADSAITVGVFLYAAVSMEIFKGKQTTEDTAS